MIRHQIALKLGLITCLSAAVVLRPSLSMANAEILDGVKPSVWPQELPQANPNYPQGSPIALQQDRVITYTQEELEQLLLVLETIQELELRPQQNQQIQELILELKQIQAQGQPAIQLSPQQTQQLENLLGSLTPEEIQRIDDALGFPSVEAAVLTQQEIQDLLSLFKGIQQLRLRPQQSQQIQSLIQELERLQAQGQPEVILTTEQSQQIQDLIDSLTPEEQEQLAELLDLPLPGLYQVSQVELQELLVLLREIQKLKLTPQQTQEVQSLIREIEQLQAQGDPQVELSDDQIQRVETLLNTLSSEQLTQLQETLPQGTVARVFTPEEFDELIRLLEAAQTLEDLEPQKAEEVQKWLDVLQGIQNRGGNEFLLTGQQIQGLENLINSLTQGQLRKIARELGIAGVGPSISVETPIGFGGYLGTGSAGIVFVNRTRNTRSADASIAASFGLGDPEQALGLDVSVAITGLSDQEGEAENLGGGSLSFQVSRMLPNDFSIAAGLQNIVTWNSGASDNGASTYLVASKILPLSRDLSQPFSIAYVSLGVGNGIYRSEDDFSPDDDLGGTPFNLFGSVALQLGEEANAIVEWTGQDLTIGLSVVPFKGVPLVFTPSFIDVTGSAGDGVRFKGNLVYSFTF